MYVHTPSSLEQLQYVACDVAKLCTKYERNQAIGGGVIAISVFDLMTLNIALSVTCYARLRDYFHQV